MILIVGGSIEDGKFIIPTPVTNLPVLIRNTENHRCSLILRPENRSKPPDYLANENTKDRIRL